MKGRRHPPSWCSLAAGAALLAAGCRCQEPSGGGTPSATAVPASASPRAPTPPPLPPFPPLTFDELPDLGSLGMPSACRLDGPPRKAALPKGNVRFVSPPGPAPALVLALDEDLDGAVDRTSVLEATGRLTGGVGWHTLDAPPVMARSSAGFLTFDVIELDRGAARVTVTRPATGLEPVVDGHRLALVDATCDGERCAVLTTLATASGGDGATVLVGSATAPPHTWERVDLPGQVEGFQPFSIVRLSSDAVWVAMNARGVVAVHRVSGGRAEAVGTLAAPFGAYDVVLGDGPVAVAPGDSLDSPCTQDGFNVRLLRANAPAIELDGQVAPSSVLTRPVAGGFFVGWISPVSCRHDARQLVRAFVFGPDGTPATSTMAVADGTGFAIATQGDAVHLWLSTGTDLVWVKARCTLEKAPAPSPSGG